MSADSQPGLQCPGSLIALRKVCRIVARFTDDREFTFGLVKHVPQLADAGDAVSAQLCKHLAFGQAAQPQLVIAKSAVVNEDPDPVVDELDDPGAEPADRSYPMRGEGGHERDHPDREGLVAGDRGPADDGADGHRRGEVDRGPLGEHPTVCYPQTQQRDQVHQSRLRGRGCHLPSRPNPAEAGVFKTASVAAAAVDKMRDAVTGRGKTLIRRPSRPVLMGAASEIAECLLDASGP